MRSLDCLLAALDKPDGSAQFQHGDTKVMVGVYGPAEVKINRELVDRATIDCIVKVGNYNLYTIRILLHVGNYEFPLPFS